MPKYFFNLADGHVSLDQEGSEVVSLEQARIEAVIYAASILRDRPDEVWAGGNWRVEVADEQGILLFTVVVMALDAIHRPRS